MLVTELAGHRCPLCNSAIGTGLKREATGWKVYAVCLDLDCGHDQRVGTIPLAAVEHTDQVFDRGEALVQRALHADRA
ncbi:MAG: hypothetical protein ACLFR6_04015 [Salinarchaeum sp.]